MDQLNILRKFREDDDPDPLLQYEGKCISTFSRSELFNVAKEKKVNLDDLILIGGIEDSRENLCKLVHYALQCSKDSEEEQEAGPSTNPEPPRKKKKTNETSVVRKILKSKELENSDIEF